MCVRRTEERFYRKNNDISFILPSTIFRFAFTIVFRVRYEEISIKMQLSQFQNDFLKAHCSVFRAI